MINNQLLTTKYEKPVIIQLQVNIRVEFIQQSRDYYFMLTLVHLIFVWANKINEFPPSVSFNCLGHIYIFLSWDLLTLMFFLHNHIIPACLRHTPLTSHIFISRSQTSNELGYMLYTVTWRKY